MYHKMPFKLYKVLDTLFREREYNRYRSYKLYKQVIIPFNKMLCNNYITKKNRLNYEYYYDNQTHLKWNGCTANNSEGSFNLGTNAYFDSIYFSYNDVQLYPIKLEVIYLDSYELGGYPEFTISLELKDFAGNMIGGELFRFQNERPDLANVARSPIFSNNK